MGLGFGKKSTFCTFVKTKKKDDPLFLLKFIFNVRVYTGGLVQHRLVQRWLYENKNNNSKTKEYNTYKQRENNLKY